MNQDNQQQENIQPDQPVTNQTPGPVGRKIVRYAFYLSLPIVITVLPLPYYMFTLTKIMLPLFWLASFLIFPRLIISRNPQFNRYGGKFLVLACLFASLYPQILFLGLIFVIFFVTDAPGMAGVTIILPPIVTMLAIIGSLYFFFLGKAISKEIYSRASTEKKNLIDYYRNQPDIESDLIIKRWVKRLVVWTVVLPLLLLLLLVIVGLIGSRYW